MLPRRARRAKRRKAPDLGKAEPLARFPRTRAADQPAPTPAFQEGRRCVSAHSPAEPVIKTTRDRESAAKGVPCSSCPFSPFVLDTLVMPDRAFFFFIQRCRSRKKGFDISMLSFFPEF